jgi:hypothetical protein
MRDLPPGDGDRAGIDLFEPGNDAEGRGLAAPRRAEKYEQFARGGAEGDIFHCTRRAPALRHAREHNLGHLMVLVPAFRCDLVYHVHRNTCSISSVVRLALRRTR